MKIYKHEFYYVEYEDRGGIEVYLNRKMSEKDFVDFYNENYAGKNLNDLEDTIVDMYVPDNILQKMKLSGDPDVNFRYEMEKDSYRTFKFYVTEINVKEK